MTSPRPHCYQQPGWQCADCGEQWPCAPARQRLRDLFRNAPLLRDYMTACWRRAVLDLRVFEDCRRGELVTRFITWTETSGR